MDFQQKIRIIKPKIHPIVFGTGQESFRVARRKAGRRSKS
ncbi:hypothetical protein ADU37_CDS08840 [Thermococcus sp. 2319x1]|nr:hypothetical protein ADU37_CDS08840 [Thermococcus sp. 2319x1]